MSVWQELNLVIQLAADFVADVTDRGICYKIRCRRMEILRPSRKSASTLSGAPRVLSDS